MKIITEFGNTYWYEGNIAEYEFLHREDGPAIIWVDSRRDWFCHGKLHRDNGPAIEHANGAYNWFQYGKLHREDGPAVRTYDGMFSWFYNGKRLPCKTQEEFEQLIKLKAFW